VTIYFQRIGKFSLKVLPFSGRESVSLHDEHGSKQCDIRDHMLKKVESGRKVL
jgi:hypothetical protein